MKIGGNIYITKGDANQAIDPYVRPRLVIGRAISVVPYLGYFYLLIKNPVGIVFFIILPALGVVFIEVIKLIQIEKNVL